MNLLTSLFALGLGVTLSLHALGQPTSESSPSGSASSETKQRLVKELTGTWEIDLRPSPDAQPYLKEFVISEFTNGTLKGVFYDTAFADGKIHTEWGKLYFAFTTGDRSGKYYTSGYVSEGKLYGMTYSQGRGFLTPWFSIRKK
jgi:hypothetical protein